MHNIGMLLLELEDFEGAVQHNSEALAMNMKVLGRDHIDVAIGSNNLGTCFFRQEKYAEAEEYFLDSLRMREVIYGPGAHRDKIEVLVNIGEVKRQQNMLEEQLEIASRCKNMAEELGGANNPEVARFLDSMCAILEHQGEYSKARRLVKRSLDIREDVFGKESLEAAYTKDILAGVYLAEKRFDEAIKLFQSSWEIRKSILGDEHPSTLQSQFQHQMVSTMMCMNS